MTRTASRERDRFLQALEARMADLLGESEERHPRLQAAMSYSVLGGGKKLRAQLLWTAGRLCDRPEEEALLDAAAAIEFIHTYSLVHDDLPAMDDDDFRRGRKSCHREFGEAMAILAGDALQALAFETIIRALSRSSLAESAQLKLVGRFAEIAGPNHLVGGQAGDLEGREGLSQEEALAWIHERKTSALIALCLQIGGTLAGLSQGKIEDLSEAGRHLGLAFQIMDDVLDETSSRELLGKTPGKDRQHGRLTYSQLHGLDRSRELAEEHLKISIGLFPPEGAAALEDLALRMVRRNS